MKTRVVILFLLLLGGSSAGYLLADNSTTLPSDGSMILRDVDTIYTTPTSVLDTLFCGDSIIVIHTVCAPICSSCVRVYNKEWDLIGRMYAPFKSIFPEAYIQDGKLLWRDNDTYDYTPAP